MVILFCQVILSTILTLYFDGDVEGTFYMLVIPYLQVNSSLPWYFTYMVVHCVYVINFFFTKWKRNEIGK
jgi:hypothetical protein